MAEGLTPCYSISGNTDPSKWGTVPISSNNTWNAVICNWNGAGTGVQTVTMQKQKEAVTQLAPRRARTASSAVVVGTTIWIAVLFLTNF